MREEELAMRPYFGAFGVFVSAVALTFATAQTPAAQQKTAPAGPPPKKNPLLKLAEPWPEADVLKQRKKESEERPLFKSIDPLEFTLTGPFNTINKDHNPDSTDRKSTRLNSSHLGISYAVFCLKKKNLVELQ